MSRARMNQKNAKLTPAEVSCLRAVNGSLHWLRTQSRPELAAQVSFSQQSFPEPTMNDALATNKTIWKAKQHADQCVVFHPIDPQELRNMMHSDAAFGNAKGGATQAGCAVSFTHQDMCMDTRLLDEFQASSCVRVSSTLSTEAQSMSVASSMRERANLLFKEAMVGFRSKIIIMLTDCKNLYDHINSPSTPALDDRRTAIDIINIIIKDSIRRLATSLRWTPTNRMLADSITKYRGLMPWACSEQVEQVASEGKFTLRVLFFENLRSNSFFASSVIPAFQSMRLVSSHKTKNFSPAPFLFIGFE